MKKFLWVYSFLFINLGLHAQQFNGSGGTIPDNGPVTAFPATVSGLSPSSIDSSFGVESVCINILHTYDSDLNIQLQSPDGTIIDLSMGNGGSGNNYWNTCFSATATNSIATGGAPFTGSFTPQYFLGTVNNGQNGNGVWNLLVQDTYPTDNGNVVSWSITFSNTPAIPFSFMSSNLPIVVINTNGQTIVDDPKINATMGIINNGPGIRNYLTDPFNDYNNNIGIELRGSSSQQFPQKSYGIETRDSANLENDTNVLKMPKEHDWILYAPYDDKTCMRNVMTYDIANKTGHYAARTVYCELVINGQYKGIYVMMEKIKRDNDRVDIAKLQITDTIGDELTGGYIIKIDKFTGSGGGGWNSNYNSSSGANIFFQYEYPSDVDIVPQQAAYIQSYVDSFENALNASYFRTDSGYAKYADVGSFVDYFILNETSRNVDGYRLSTFLYKQKDSDGGKLFAGPAWDYNLAWWNADYCNGYLTTGWAYQFNSVCGGDPSTVPFWWSRMLQDTSFTSLLKCRWTELRQTTLNIDTLFAFIDSNALYLDEAKDRHFRAWPILGIYTWPNPSPIPADYPGEIAAMKSWIQQRFTWLDLHMPGVCTTTATQEFSTNTPSAKVYPNPFDDALTVSVTLDKSALVTIDIFDIAGKKVRSINYGLMSTGKHHVEIKPGREKLMNGVYFLKATAGDTQYNFKVVKK